MYFVRQGGLRRGLAAFLCAVLLLTACGPAEGVSSEGAVTESVTATTMYLTKSEGSVGLTDEGGTELEPVEQMGLYSGYQVATRMASYAWIDLDRVKLTKMDSDSEVELSKKGKELELLLKTGRLFFNVTEPLADDEAMNIRTSSMVVGIRGTPASV